MELITLVAVICNQQFCQQKVIADSNHVPLTLQQCRIQAQFGIAQWLNANRQYQSWTVKGWSCHVGVYIAKRGA